MSKIKPIMSFNFIIYFLYNLIRKLWSSLGVSEYVQKLSCYSVFKWNKM